MKPKKEPEAAEPTEIQEIRALVAAIPEVLVDRRFTFTRKPTGEVTVKAGDGPVIAIFPIDERPATRADGVAIANAFMGIRWLASQALAWHRDLHTACAMYEARIAQQAQEIERIDAVAAEYMRERDEARAEADSQRAEHIARMYCITGWGACPALPPGWNLLDADREAPPAIRRRWPVDGHAPAHAVSISAVFNDFAEWMWHIEEDGKPMCEDDHEQRAGCAGTLAAAIAAGEAAVKARREAIAAASLVVEALDSAPVP